MINFPFLKAILYPALYLSQGQITPLCLDTTISICPGFFSCYSRSGFCLLLYKFSSEMHTFGGDSTGRGVGGGGDIGSSSCGGSSGTGVGTGVSMSCTASNDCVVTGNTNFSEEKK